MKKTVGSFSLRRLFRREAKLEFQQRVFELKHVLLALMGGVLALVLGVLAVVLQLEGEAFEFFLKGFLILGQLLMPLLEFADPIPQIETVADHAKKCFEHIQRASSFSILAVLSRES